VRVACAVRTRNRGFGLRVLCLCVRVCVHVRVSVSVSVPCAVCRVPCAVCRAMLPCRTEVSRVCDARRVVSVLDAHGCVRVTYVILCERVFACASECLLVVGVCLCLFPSRQPGWTLRELILGHTGGWAAVQSDDSMEEQRERRPGRCRRPDEGLRGLLILVQMWEG
jgi:hypothetical protein